MTEPEVGFADVADRNQESNVPDARERGHLRVGASEPQRAAELLAAAGFAHVEPADGHLRVFDAQERVPEIARVLVGGGIALTELAPAREDLESYFLRLTEGVE